MMAIMTVRPMRYRVRSKAASLFNGKPADSPADWTYAAKLNIRSRKTS
jgi:hypothetical protein